MNKYLNKKVVVDGYTFDSKKEAKRYLELKLLLRSKQISELKLHPKFLLQDSFKKDGVHHRAITYIADFSYIKNDNLYVEDVKSSFTKKLPVYAIKKKLLLFKYDVIFLEI